MMPQSSPGRNRDEDPPNPHLVETVAKSSYDQCRNRDEDPPNPHLVETVAKSSYDQRRVDTVTRICLTFTWSRPWQRVPMVNAVTKICPPVETLISHLLKHSKLPRKAMT
ncbi:hypothetical protein ACLKA6_000650 [Drosophila palustris]